MKHLAASVLLALAGAVEGALAAAPAGEVVLLTGRGSATNPADGGIRELAKGDAFFAGEILNSSVNSYMNLRFADGSFVLLRPNSRFVVEAYEYAGEAPAATPEPPPAAAPAKPATPAKPAAPTTRPAPTPAPPVVSAPPATSPPPAGSSRAFFRLLKGGFRAVSGLIGKADRNEYRVATPVATIGIRGTDYVAVICDAACARDPVLREDLPAGAGAEGGLIAGVIDGGIGVTSGSGTQVSGTPTLSAATMWIGASAVGGAPQHTELGPGQFLAVTNNGRHVPLDNMPRFLVVNPIPNPTNVCPQ